MNNIVVIKPYPSRSSLLIISKQLAQTLNLTRKKYGYVSFGTQKHFVDIVVSEKPMDGEILLSKSVIEDLHLPDYPTFEILANKNEIAIGPCIGMAVSQKDKNITKRRLKEITMNTLNYNAIRGAIIVFALDKVDKAKRLIEGYCYNPKTNSFERGIFPYPLSIYRRTHFNTEWQNHFLSAIGDTVFNNYTFDKWKMYKWFSNEPDIMPYLPLTKIFETRDDIYGMLEKYSNIYAKPISGMKGFGVIRISLKNGKYIFKYRENEENKVITAEGRSEADKIIEKLFSPNNYIIQQGIDLMKHEGGVIDFRCVMQKDNTQNWVCNGIVARTGAKGSVVSNISSGGSAMPAVEMMRDALSMGEREIYTIKEKMISLCMKVCRTLDEYGINYGTLGLDLGLDTQKNLWLIEVNNRRPHPAIALRANDILSYYSILSSPLSYAKSLSGF